MNAYTKGSLLGRATYIASDSVLQLILLVKFPALAKVSKMLVTGGNQLFFISLPRQFSCFWSRWELLCNVEMAVHMIISPMLLNVSLL